MIKMNIPLKYFTKSILSSVPFPSTYNKSCNININIVKLNLYSLSLLLSKNGASSEGIFLIGGLTKKIKKNYSQF